jgi:hypothetical protein
MCCMLTHFIQSGAHSSESNPKDIAATVPRSSTSGPDIRKVSKVLGCTGLLVEVSTMDSRPKIDTNRLEPPTARALLTELRH